MAAVKSQQVSDVSSVSLPVLLRRPRAPAQLDKDVVRSKISKPRNALKVKSDKQFDIFTYDNLLVSPRYELQSPTCVDPLRPKSPVVVKSEKLPAHHTSLQELASLNNSQSLVKPLKVRGPDPLPARLVKKNPVLLHTSFDEDIEQYCKHPPLFTLTDFIVQYSASENVSVDNVHKALCSRYTYDRLQKLLLETIQSKSTKLSVQDLKVPDCVSVGPQRIPQRQILVEMALALKEQLSQVTGLDVRSSVRTALNYNASGGSYAEIIFSQEKSTDDQQNLSELLQITEIPGTDSIVHGPTTRYFNGSRRTGSPFGMPDNNALSPSELGILDSLFNGGRALSLKAQFISELPDVQLLRDTVEYVNLSFNNFKVIPVELFDMPLLSVLLMRNNPIKEISSEICRLCTLTTCVFSFGMLSSLPVELFTLTQMVHLDVSYNLLTFIQTEIGNLTKLVELNVEGNQLVAVPVGLIRMKYLKRLNVSNNRMHPAFWKNSINDQSQLAADLSSISPSTSNAVYSNNMLPADHAVRPTTPSRQCDVCGAARPDAAAGFCAIRPIQKIFGVKNLPVLFQCCSLDCKTDFMSRKDGLSQLLYG